jgi:hypothetical protein
VRSPVGLSVCLIAPRANTGMAFLRSSDAGIAVRLTEEARKHFDAARAASHEYNRAEPLTRAADHAAFDSVRRPARLRPGNGLCARPGLSILLFSSRKSSRPPRACIRQCVCPSESLPNGPPIHCRRYSATAVPAVCMHAQDLDQETKVAMQKCRSENDAVYFQRPPRELPALPPPKRLASPTEYRLPAVDAAATPQALECFKSAPLAHALPQVLPCFCMASSGSLGPLVTVCLSVGSCTACCPGARCTARAAVHPIRADSSTRHGSAARQAGPSEADSGGAALATHGSASAAIGAAAPATRPPPAADATYAASGGGGEWWRWLIVILVRTGRQSARARAHARACAHTHTHTHRETRVYVHGRSDERKYGRLKWMDGCGMGGQTRLMPKPLACITPCVRHLNLSQHGV